MINEFAGVKITINRFQFEYAANINDFIPYKASVVS